MTRLLDKLEAERRKLNKLACQSLRQGIPLIKNEAVQAQSRKVDELIVQMHQKKAKRKYHLR